jgi:hypothetical protein
VKKTILVLITAVLLASCGGASSRCRALELAYMAACQSESPACTSAKLALTEAGCVVPGPQPTVEPTVPPTDPPPVTTTTTTTVPIPPPTPPPLTGCPASPVPLDKRYIQTKVVRRDEGTGLPGTIDSTPRVRDHDYCARATGDASIFDCKANPEGSGYSLCDTEFLGGWACPIWQYSVNGGSWARCDPSEGEITCDHFDGWNEQQPYTGPCERNSQGSPIAGFVMVAHGQGYVRACTRDGVVCSPGQAVDH